MGAQDEDLQSEIERLVLVDDQCVTYKWLAYERGMAMKDAQEALRQFAAQRSDETKKRSVVTYLVTGRSKSSKVAHNVKIVREEKLEAAKAKMDVVLATHIYAVQPAVDTDTSTALANTTHAKVCDLLNSDDSVSKDLIENRLGAVSFSGRGGIGSRRVVAEPRRNKVFTRPASEGPSFVAPAFKRMNSKGTKKISSKDFFKQKKPAASTGPAAKEKEKKKGATENSDAPSASSLRASDELSEKSSVSSSSNKNNTTANNSNNNNKKKVNSDPASESTKKTARTLDDQEDKDTEAPRKKKKLKVLEDDSDEEEFELDDAVQNQNVNSKKDSKEASSKSEKDAVTGIDEKKKPTSQESDERIDQDGDHQLADAEDSENDADRVARQREALANEEAETRAKEKAEKREAEREANRLARQERKRKEEEAAKAKARERLGVQISKPGAQTGATRKVKKRRVVKETVEDDEGFLVVRERVIEEEVDEPIPESISSASSSDKKEAKGAATSTKTSTSKTAKKPGTKPKQLTLSSMFKKK